MSLFLNRAAKLDVKRLVPLLFMLRGVLRIDVAETYLGGSSASIVLGTELSLLRANNKPVLASPRDITHCPANNPFRYSKFPKYLPLFLDILYQTFNFYTLKCFSYNFTFHQIFLILHLYFPNRYAFLDSDVKLSRSIP